MDARINIVGNLTQDVRNLTNKLNRKQAIFKVAVDINEKETYFFDCFLNYHLSDDDLQRYKKGSLVSLTGKYNQFCQKTKFDNSIAVRRIINIIEHNTTISRGRYVQNINVHLNGYIIDTPICKDGRTIFEVAERKLEEGTDENKRFIVELPYSLNNLEQYTEDSLIYISGYYSEFLNFHPVIGARIKRKIQARDIEVLVSISKQQRKKTLGELLNL